MMTRFFQQTDKVRTNVAAMASDEDLHLPLPLLSLAEPSVYIRDIRDFHNPPTCVPPSYPILVSWPSLIGATRPSGGESNGRYYKPARTSHRTSGRSTM